MEPLLSYFSNEYISLTSPGLKLQVESFKLWRTFVHYGQATDSLSILQPVLLRLLDYHLKNTNVTSSWTLQEHSSTYLNLLSKFIEMGFHNNLLEYLKNILDLGLLKWGSQFATLQEYSCGKLQLISSLMNILAKTLNINQFTHNFPKDIVCSSIENLINSQGFDLVTKKLQSGSNILNNYKVCENSPNFKYTEAAAWNTADHIVPILQSTSCLPFVTSLSEFVSKSASKSLKMKFLTHKNIQGYLKTLTMAKNYYLTSNWYTKIESIFILNVLKISVDLQSDLADTSMYYEIAVKSLCIYTSEQKPEVQKVFNSIIFSPKFYPAEVLIKNLNMEENFLQTSLKYLNDILTVYTNVLGLNKNLIDLKESQILDVSLGNILPLDWTYSPIIALYSNQHTQSSNESKISEEEQNFVISNCLRWVYVYETYFPSLAAIINPTDKFCRLSCTFLGSDTLFLLPEIQNLLSACLKQLLSKNEEDFEFDRPIHGLKSFQDLYTQLLEQYQGVSYGDKLFGNFILVPLAQKHSVKFRKALWSEYAAIVQIFNVTPDEIFCDLQRFLYPVEEDLSLIQCYRKIIASGSIRKSSVLYKIAKYHVEGFGRHNTGNNLTA